MVRLNEWRYEHETAWMYKKAGGMPCLQIQAHRKNPFWDIRLILKN
jgi:hypothetical protein